MTCWYRKAVPDAGKWAKGQLSTESTRSVRYWVIADDKGRVVVCLSNAQLTVQDETLQLDEFVKAEAQRYQSERWNVVFEKSRAR